MIEDNSDIFIKDSTGVVHEVHVEITFFDDDEPEKQYVVYTDGTFDVGGRLRGFVSVYREDSSRLMPASDNDFTFVEAKIADLLTALDSEDQEQGQEQEQEQEQD